MKPCNVEKCKGICCTFLVYVYPRRLDEDFKRFLGLHGCEIKEEKVTKYHTSAIITYVKMPVPCKEFDSTTFKCKIYENRPNWCRVNPRKAIPFITKEICEVI